MITNMKIKYGALGLAIMLLALVAWRLVGAPDIPGAPRQPHEQSASQPRLERRAQVPDSAQERVKKMFGSPVTPKEQHEAQMKLREELKGMAKNDSVDLILAYLNSGADQASQLPFKVGRGGILVAAPSMRVWMLDILEEIDRGAAMAYAETIFENSEIADEWAIALRSAALGREDEKGRLDEADRSYVKSRALSLLGNKGWREESSNGYLESFDVVPYMGDQDLLAEVGIRLSSGGPEAKAAFISVNKTVVNNSQLIESLVPRLRNAEVSSSAIGQIVALSDPNDPKQQTYIKSWIQNTDIPSEEKTAFLAMFPMLGITANYSLFSSSENADFSQLAQRLSGAMLLLINLRESVTESELKTQIEQAINKATKMNSK